MLAQSNTVHPAVAAAGLRAVREESVWRAIESTLRKRGAATTYEIAQAIGMSTSAAYSRLGELRELGEVRFGTPRGGTRLRTWELGAEDFVMHEESMQPVLTKAVQLGIFERDPLVTALFGTGMARCVNCRQPQGQPHEPECAFNGLDIDAAHRGMPLGG